MKEFFSNGLHLFVTVMVAAFIIGGILAVAGTFDHWGSRYLLKRRRKRLLRSKSRQPEDNKPAGDKSKSHYNTTPPKKTDDYKGGYA